MNPRVFVASSSDVKKIAIGIQKNLEDHADVTVWHQGFFELSKTTIESLVSGAQEMDFAIFVFSPSDIVEMKGEKKHAIRDNVIFELGLFIGALGLNRCFLFAPKSIDSLHIPTDLLGITLATYSDGRDDNNYTAATAPACSEVEELIEKHGRLIRQTASPIALGDVQAESCPISKFEIDRLITQSSPTIVDDSSIWLLLFSISDQFRCEQVREELKNFDIVEAVYDLYGDQDLLVKIRVSKDNAANYIDEHVVEPLGKKNLLGRKRRHRWASAPKIIDISSEHYYLPPDLVPHAGEESRGIKAFFHISSLPQAELKTYIRECLDAANSHKRKAVFIGAYASTQDIVAEFYVPCGAFYDLSKIVVDLEQELADFEAKRQTWVAMTVWETEHEHKSNGAAS